MKKLLTFVIVPAVAVAMVFFESTLFSHNVLIARFLAVALVMIVWWMTEIVPLSITALLPVALFPLLGIMKGEVVSSLYFNDILMLLLGGFLIAIAVEKSGLHVRFSTLILSVFGHSPRYILLGLMTSNAFLSAWISNTTGTVMMIPVAMASLKGFSTYLSADRHKSVATGLFLGIAYSSSIGGISTLIGTPPNLIFQKIYHQTFPSLPQVTFATWAMIGVPLSLLMLVLTWGVLVYMFKIPAGRPLSEAPKPIPLPRMGWDEGWVLTIFLITIFLWTFRSDLNLGVMVLPGIGTLFPKPDFLDDGVIAIFMSIFLFLIPSRSVSGKRLLGAVDIKKIPWNVVLLFGGGFALASGFIHSGFSAWISQYFTYLSSLPVWTLIATISASSTFLSEIASNTAIAQVMMPILAQLAIHLRLSPFLLMVTSTISNSFSFMLPTSTPPNAIIFGTGKVPLQDMIRVGFLLNLLGILVVTLFMVGVFFWMGAT